MTRPGRRAYPSSPRDNPSASRQLRGQLSPRSIIDAAFAMSSVDCDFTMRKLAEELGVSAMAVYRYFQNKEQLLQAMHLTLWGRVKLPSPKLGWKEFLRALAQNYVRDLGSSNIAGRLIASHSEVSAPWYEHLNATVDVLGRAGFKPRESVAIFRALTAFALGEVVWDTAVPEEGRDYGGHSKVNTHLLPTESEKFAVGLDAMLVGFEARL